MQERVHLVNGIFRHRIAGDKGTTVSASVPLVAREDTSQSSSAGGYSLSLTLADTRLCEDQYR
jgi:hypothetical protein